MLTPVTPPCSHKRAACSTKHAATLKWVKAELGRNGFMVLVMITEQSGTHCWWLLMKVLSYESACVFKRNAVRAVQSLGECESWVEKNPGCSPPSYCSTDFTHTGFQKIHEKEIAKCAAVSTKRKSEPEETRLHLELTVVFFINKSRRCFYRIFMWPDEDRCHITLVSPPSQEIFTLFALWSKSVTPLFPFVTRLQWHLHSVPTSAV